MRKIFMERRDTRFLTRNGLVFLQSKRKEIKKLAVVLVLFASGCATSNGAWVMPGATLADFERDKAQCLYEAEAAVQVPNYGYTSTLGQSFDIAFRRQSLAASCMKAKGWRYVVEK